jgi:prepilin peptidase CpaA
MEWSAPTRAVLLAGLALTCVYTDVSRGKIYNKIVLPFVPIGLALWAVTGGWDGIVYGLAGLGIGAITLLIAGGLRWIAPGDAKLLTAIGALMGPAFVGSAMVFAGLAGGLIGLTMMARRRLIRQWAAGSVLAWSAHLPISSFWIDRAGFMPYSIPIAMGCAIAGIYPLWR